MKPTTLDIEIAMIKAFNPRQNLIVPNVSWGIFGDRECDLVVLSKSSYATEIEIKVTKSDLRNDKRKRHNHSHGLIARTFFAIPTDLVEVALETIPEHCGLYTVGPQPYQSVYGRKYTRTVVTLVRNAVRNKDAVQWTEDRRYQLARLGSMRILGLKQAINILNKNEHNRKATRAKKRN